MLSGAQGALLRNWLPVGLGSGAPRLQLLYRASRDGWAAQAFHGRCDGRGATVTLVHVANDSLFGGYADKPWRSPETVAYVSSSAAFLFSLQSPAGSPPLKMPIDGGDRGRALLHHARRGPAFGCYGCDLGISDNANTNQNSCCSHGSYTGHVANSMAGSQNFNPDEVAVFAVVYEA